MVCSGSFHFLQATTSQNILTCKFTVNQLYVAFITKEYKGVRYEVGQLKVGQVLQSGVGITRRGNFRYKVGNYYKSSTVQKTNKRNGEEQ